MYIEKKQKSIKCSENIILIDDDETTELSNKFGQFINNYRLVNKNNFCKENEILKIITDEIPELLIELLDLDKRKILLKGSGGNGRVANIPWLAIFITNITKKASKGLYLVFLVKADLSGMYLSLNQGFTYFENKYGKKKSTKTRVKNTAIKIRNLLNTIPKESLIDIDLNCTNDLGKGYEAGNIAAKYYSIDNMPSDEELVNDIKDYIVSYKELSRIIGNRSVEQFYDYLLLKDDGYELTEDEEIEAVDKVLASGKSNKEEIAEFKGEKKPKKDSVIDNKGKKSYPRDPKVAANAIKIAVYKCEVDEHHTSFIRRSNGKKYTESHHLIPLNCQDDFEFSLDVEENVCSVCSNCHNCIHYGTDEERLVILNRLYDERKEYLDKVGLNISFDGLKKYYKMSSSL